VKLVAAALGGAATTIVVVAILFKTGALSPPHEHREKRDLQAEIAFDYVSKHDDRLNELESLLKRWWFCPALGVDEKVALDAACRREREQCERENLRCIPVTSAWCNDARPSECFFSQTACHAAGGHCRLMPAT